ncbi:MAG: hypothetical protein ACHP8A_11905, partial [Terriglobales bacterium]
LTHRPGQLRLDKVFSLIEGQPPAQAQDKLRLRLDPLIQGQESFLFFVGWLAKKIFDTTQISAFVENHLR